MKQYQSVSVKVVRSEYLIARYLEGSAKTPKRRERAAHEALQNSRSERYGRGELRTWEAPWGIEP
ncbi:MAG TPA: hypothetical protein VEO54_20225 [Thermoanaerobaculia bacterium]|nr:hypothetical protein [Thermoanaerobaculia bacterium]